MADVFVVEGSTGEYSDNRSWLVCAYSSEDAAKAKVSRLVALAKTAEVVRDGKYEDEDTAERREWEMAFGALRAEDPRADMDYTGTGYSYGRVPLDPPEARHG